jgi:hypothetical protein
MHAVRYALLAAILAGAAAAGCSDRERAEPEPPAASDPPALAKPAGEDAPKDAPAPEASPESKPIVSGDEDIYDEPQADRDERRAPKKEAKRKRASTKEAPAADAPAALRVKRIQFAEKVASREPVDPEETFTAGETEQLFAFVELANDTKHKSKIVVTFIPPTGAPSKVTLDVGDKPRWRTWALRRGVRAVGTWTVTIHHEGREIGRRTFVVADRS